MTGVSDIGWIVTWGAWKRAKDVKSLADIKREQEGKDGERVGRGGWRGKVMLVRHNPSEGMIILATDELTQD